LSLLGKNGLGSFHGPFRSSAANSNLSMQNVRLTTSSAICISSTYNLVLVNDPSFGMKTITEEDLRWYLEDYAPKYPYDVTRAAQVEIDLMKYGQTLVDSFQVLSIEMVRLVVSIERFHFSTSAMHVGVGELTCKVAVLRRT